MRIPAPVSPAQIESFSLQAKEPVRGAALLIHGLTGTPDELRELAEVLSGAGYHVHAPLLSGHGDSVAQLKRIQLDQWKSDAKKAADFATVEGFPLIVVGLSFGGLLALHLATTLERVPAAVVVMSAPFILRSRSKDLTLRILSRLPDRLLNILPVVKKSRRRPDHLSRTHLAFPVHCVGAGARIVRLRQELSGLLSKLKMPILLVQDPFDHHLDPSTIEEIAARVSSSNRELLHLVGGEHEITIGHRARDLHSGVLEFLTRASTP